MRCNSVVVVVVVVVVLVAIAHGFRIPDVVAPQLGPVCACVLGGFDLGGPCKIYPSGAIETIPFRAQVPVLSSVGVGASEDHAVSHIPLLPATSVSVCWFVKQHKNEIQIATSTRWHLILGPFYTAVAISLQNFQICRPSNLDLRPREKIGNLEK